MTRKKSCARPCAIISDMTPGRDVVRRDADGRCWVIDTWEQYAPVEVESDALTPERRASFLALTPSQRAIMTLAFLRSPYLSDEGRRERLAMAAECETIRYTFEVLS